MYELLKECKEKGFPQKQLGICKSPGCKHYGTKKWIKKPNYCNCFVYQPTLEEAIEACGVDIKLLVSKKVSYATCERFDQECIDFEGSTPLEAVLKLWIALQDNK